MKPTHETTIILLLKKALPKRGYYSDEIKQIQLSPSQQIADVVTTSARFSVLLSERSASDVLSDGGFALSADAIYAIDALRLRYVFFFCHKAGFLMESCKGPHSFVLDYHDEFGSRVRIFLPLEAEKVSL